MANWKWKIVKLGGRQDGNRVIAKWEMAERVKWDKAD